MAKPWEQYQNSGSAPWEKYESQAIEAPQAKKLAPLSRVDKVAKGAADPFDAGAQLLEKMLPDSVSNAITGANNYLAEKTGLFPMIGEGGVDALIKKREKSYQARRKAQGEEGFDGYRLVGNVVSPANLAVASRLPVAGAGLAKTMGAGGVLAATTQPVFNDGDFATEKAKQFGAGAAFAPLGNMLARGISPKASTNPQLKLLKKEGVRPTIGQTLGGGFNKAEEKLASVPILGDMVNRARNTANDDFERAAFNRALAPLKKALPKNIKGNEAVEYVEDVLKTKYDDVLTDIGAITPDEQFTSKISSLSKMVDDYVMPDAEKMKFRAVLHELNKSIDDNGVITSSAFKKLESSLGTKAQKLARSDNVFDSDMAMGVKQVQQELREMLERQAGSKAGELKKANEAWANFKRVQNASSRVGTDTGSFTPAQFQSAVRATDKSKDKAAFARGSALGQDLGAAGKSVLGNKVANSGTADRLLMSGAGIYSMFEPTVGLPLLAGSSLYTNPVQGLLTKAVSSRPESAVGLSQLPREYGKYIFPTIGGGLLQNN